MAHHYRKQEPPTEGGKWLNGKQACEFLGISSTTLARWIDAEIIPYKLRKTPYGYKKMYNTVALTRALEPVPVTQFDFSHMLKGQEN